METAAHLNRHLETRSLYAKYRELRAQLNVVAEQAGESPFVDPDGGQAFLSLSPAQQVKLVDNLERTVLILSGSVHLLGRHPSHFYLRAAMKKYGWKIDSSVFELLGQNDTIEVYGTDFLLRVANMRFLQVCSYSLEDALSHEFWELFDRDASITTALVEQSNQLFKGNGRIALEPAPAHVVEERFSIKKKRFWVEPKLLTPVFSTHNTLEGVLFSATVNVLDASKGLPVPTVTRAV